MNILLINESQIIIKMFESIERKIKAKIHTTLNLTGIEIKNFNMVIINENVLERSMVKTIKKENPDIKLALLIKKGSKKNNDFDFCIEKPFLPIELINILKQETSQGSAEEKETDTNVHQVFNDLDLEKNESDTEDDNDEIDLSDFENDDLEAPVAQSLEINDDDLEASLEKDLEKEINEISSEEEKEDVPQENITTEEDSKTEAEIEDDISLDDLEDSLENDENQDKNEVDDVDLDLNNLDNTKNDNSLLNENEVKEIKELLNDESKEKSITTPASSDNIAEQIETSARDRKDILLKTINELQLSIFEDFDIDINISLKKK